MNTESCVFIIDDDYAVRDSLGQVMDAAGIAYQTFESAEHFLRDYCPGKPGCVLLDLNMPNMSGEELQTELIRRQFRLPIIFLTAYGDMATKARVMKAGAVDFLIKPIPSNQLLERIQLALQHECQT
ncbi:response regulator [Methylomonas sp. LL1]|uniref:response regulator transcription factor n=1 Tax=Methylomonas sp. LL1 TaxID=2785785 RepID=UPI0018C3C099|nr:response regulator [Methylomonas sp. LL1]QPK63620.1 response regulator [Methylomonas sp. LL1]